MTRLARLPRGPRWQRLEMIQSAPTNTAFSGNRAASQTSLRSKKVAHVLAEMDRLLDKLEVIAAGVGQ